MSKFSEIAKSTFPTGTVEDMTIGFESTAHITNEELIDFEETANVTLTKITLSDNTLRLFFEVYDETL